MNKVAMGGTACFVEVILLRSKVSSRQFVRLAASRAMGPWRRVLLTNDDGYASPALLKLREALEKGEKVETTVVAPNSNQSACGQRLTLTGRMDLTNHCEIGQRVYSITGSPSDCAILALDPGGIMHDPPPTLVVSGINLGSNMSHDVLYSGTFAGARQAAMLGYPAIATSLAGDDFSEKSLAAAVDATMSITHRLLEILPIRPENPSRQELKRQPHNMYANSSACEDINMAVFHAFRCGDIVLNVNTPCKWSGNFQCTSLAAIAYRDTVQRDNHEMWLGEVTVELLKENSRSSDVLVAAAGDCSISTLQTWPESHPFRVPEFLLEAARMQGPNGLPAWISEVAASVSIEGS